MPVNPLGELLERERAKRDRTLTDFARDVLGIDHSLVSRYVNGVQSPSRRTVRKIATALEMAPADIEALLGHDEPEADDRATLEDAKELLLDAVDDLSPQTIVALAKVLRESKGGRRGARSRPRA